MKPSYRAIQRPLKPFTKWLSPRILVLCCLATFFVHAGHAATVTVTGTGDADTADGVCTLREAIEAANNNSSVNGDCVHDGSSGTDTIAFDIPGAGPHTISPSEVLPTISGPVIIDGTTQPGASCAAWPPTLLIEIEGSGVPGFSGLIFSSGAAGSTVRGLVINRFGDRGINSSASNSTIQCNFVGTDPTGMLPLGNGFNGFLTSGISFSSADNVLIGSDGDGVNDDAERNLISANGGGIRVFGGDDFVIGGNYIGPDITGTSQPGTDPFNLIQGWGVWFDPGSNNQIGTNGRDDAAAMRNLISANGTGVDINGGSRNTVAGNYIGTDLDGTGNLGNAVGVDVEGAGARNNVIGTNSDGDGDAAERNIIAGGGSGVKIRDGSNNVVAGNLIGTDVTGTVALTSTLPPVDVGIELGGPDNRIGTDGDGQNDAGEANLISGRGFVGIFVDGASSTGNRIAGNRIGTDAAGTGPLANGNGIIMFGVDDNTIGGPQPAHRNVVRFNTENGVEFVESTGNLLQSNQVSDNGENGVNNRGGSPTMRANNITRNGASGIRNVASRSSSPATPDDDVLARPVIATNMISGNCTVGAADCAGIFSLDTEPASIGATPMANNGAPFVEQRWFGAVEVIDMSGTPVAERPTIDSSNGGPSYSLTHNAACTGGLLNNTIIHGVDPALSCDDVSTWTQFVEFVTDENGVMTRYTPQSEAFTGAVYSFDADASTHPTDTGSGFIGEGITTASFSRYQIMELSASGAGQPQVAISATAIVQGAGALFTSWGVFYNDGQSDMELELTFTPRQGSAGMVETAQLNLPAGLQYVTDDLLGDVFGYANNRVGSVMIDVVVGSPNDLKVNTVINANLGTGERYGQNFPAVPLSEGVGENTTAYLPTTEDPESYRVNAAFMGVSSGATQITVRPEKPLGTVLGTDVVLDLGLGETAQINDIHDSWGLGNESDVVLVAEVDSGRAQMLTSVLDDRGTNDPTTLSYTTGGFSRVVVPEIGDIVGIDTFGGSLNLSNYGFTSSTVTANFYQRGRAGIEATEQIVLLPGETMGWSNFVVDIFGIDGAVGAVELMTGNPRGISATGREYAIILDPDTGEEIGTAGQLMPGRTGSERSFPGRIHHFIGLRQTRGESFDRCHFFAFNDGSSPVEARVVLYDGESSLQEGERTYVFPAQTLRQYNNVIPAINPDHDEEYKRVEVFIDGPLYMFFSYVNEFGDPVTFEPQ